MYTNGLKDRFGSPLVSKRDVEQQLVEPLEAINGRLTTTEENLSKVSEDLETTKEEIVTEIREDLNTKADLVLDNTFSGQNIFTNDVTIENGVIKFNPEDENLIPANSVTNEAKIYAESAANNAAFVNDIAETLKDYALNEGKNIEIDSNGIIETKIGHTYVVTTNNEPVTVKMMKYGVETDFILCSAYPYNQASFMATSGGAKLSNINCIVTEVRGISIELGGGTGEPEGDYLTFDENSIVTGGRLDYATNIYALQYGRQSLTSWSMPLPSVQTADYAFYYTKIKKWEISLPECLSIHHFLANSAVEVWEADIPKAKDVNAIFNRCYSLHTVKGNFESVENGYEFCYLCSGLKVIDATFPKLSDGRGFATSAKLDKVSALRIFNSIPAHSSGSHQLAIGIHIDHKTDEEVLAAIAAAEAKGWTLSLGWNGTPTASAASTYGLRTPSIYARVIEGEHGKHLDWGHYVTDPTGYEEFATLEEALETWGLTEYMEIPNEEQINN